MTRTMRYMACALLAALATSALADDFMTSGIVPDSKTQAKPCPYSDPRKCWNFGDANFVFQALLSIRTRLISDESTIASHTNEIAQLQTQVANLQKIVGGSQGVPTISSIAPTSGPVGTQVTITGTKLTGATAVKLNGTTAQYTVASDTSITTQVPTGATTGTWAVTTGGGTATSGTFTVSANSAPTISGIAPANGSRGDAITVTGTNLNGATGVNFNGTTATFTAISSTTIVALVPSGATTGVIGVTTSGGSATSGTFTINPNDNILASNLISLPTGAWVGTDPDNGDATIATIAYYSGSRGSITEVGTGYHYIQTWNSKWTGTPTLNTPYEFQARLAAGSTSSPYVQIQSYGQVSPTVNFNLATCTGTDTNGASHTAAPVTGQANTCDVTVTGQFVSTSLSHNGASWNVTVETTTTGGPAAGVALYVENARLQLGSGTPVITSFSPTSGPVGTAVTVTGRNFTGATSVRFNGTNASFSVSSDTTISTTVPSGATTGAISVVTPGGTGVTSSNFTVQ